MRAPSWLLGSKVQFEEVPKPDLDRRVRERLEAVARSARRRLSDRIEEVFHEACLVGDLHTAATLLSAYEHAATHGVRPDAGERRDTRPAIARLRQALDSRRATASA